MFQAGESRVGGALFLGSLRAGASGIMEEAQRLPDSVCLAVDTHGPSPICDLSSTKAPATSLWTLNPFRV